MAIIHPFAFLQGAVGPTPTPTTAPTATPTSTPVTPTPTPTSVGPTRTYFTSGELTDVLYLNSYNNLLDSSYTGDCLRVRRSSDNTTQDIGFTASGLLDESALTTFVGSGDGFVVRWYSQTGTANSRYIFATNNAAQAKIVDQGTVVKINGYVAPLYNSTAAGAGTFNANRFSTTSWNGANNSTSNYSIFAVKTKASNEPTYLFSTIGGGGWPTIIYGYNNGGTQGAESYVDNERYIITGAGNVSTTALSLQTVLRTPATGTVTGYFNGTQSFSQTSTKTYSDNRTLQHFMANNNKGTAANMSEFILYNATKTSDVSAINSNIVNYYSL